MSSPGRENTLDTDVVCSLTMSRVTDVLTRGLLACQGVTLDDVIVKGTHTACVLCTWDSRVLGGMSCMMYGTVRKYVENRFSMSSGNGSSVPVSMQRSIPHVSIAPLLVTLTSTPEDSEILSIFSFSDIWMVVS